MDIAKRLDRIDAKLDAFLTTSQRDAVTGGREWLPIDEAAEICGFQPWTLRQACATGRLHSIDPAGVRKLDDGTWRIWWQTVESIRNNGLPKVR